MTTMPVALPADDSATLTAALLLELTALRDRLNRITDRLSVIETLNVDQQRPAVPRIAIRRQRISRGWSQTALIARLRTAASQRGYRVPGDASMKTMLSKWENGHTFPGQFYADLLAQVFTAHPVNPMAVTA